MRNELPTPRPPKRSVIYVGVEDGRPRVSADLLLYTVEELDAVIKVLKGARAAFFADENATN